MNQHRTVIRKPANHALHLVLTVLTLGMWAPVWAVMAVVGRKETVTYPSIGFRTEYSYARPDQEPVWNPNAHGPGSGGWQHPPPYVNQEGWR